MFSPDGLVRSTHVDTYAHFAWRLGFGYNSRIYPWCWSCCFLSRWHQVLRPSWFAYAHETEHAGSAGLLVVLLVCHLTCLDLGRGQLIQMSLNSDVMSSGFGSFEWSSTPWTSVMSLSFCEVIQLRIGFFFTSRYNTHGQRARAILTTELGLKLFSCTEGVLVSIRWNGCVGFFKRWFWTQSAIVFLRQ